MNGNNEIWKLVNEYEGDYSVSNFGNVRSERTTTCTYTGRMLKNVTHRCGYLQVGLYKNGRAKIFLVHRLVASAFLGPCPPGFQVNHKDGNKANNHLDNLEYITPVENTRHAIATLGYRAGNGPGELCPTSKLTAVQVLRIRQLVKQGEKHATISAAYGVSRRCVGHIVCGATWKHLLV